ncbi:MAG: tRNA pseudouridine(55) synthase TruB [Rhabdochlamydiaceae bacterium]|nr:tRNA pseudouridine(55) synthase TruB [Rhabdochlamydiaceae bacterium]
MLQNKPSGLLLVNKPKGKTSFSLVSVLRRICQVQKIGHAGTLDPFASGVMLLLIGKDFTRLSDRFLTQDKEYIATLHLGVRTDSYDCEGTILEESSYVPSLEELASVISRFQGTYLQTPPMFSAKKIGGKKLYELARKGITIERPAASVTTHITLLSYDYPLVKIHVASSKGTYIRSLAEDIGLALNCGAHLVDLVRSRSGPFLLENCLDGSLLFGSNPPDTLPLISLENLTL